ncbi:MAG: Ig-like domain-containing protein [Pseudonocardiaceae bacterium]
MFTIAGRRLPRYATPHQRQVRSPRLRRGGGWLPRRLGAVVLAAMPIMAMGAALPAPASADTAIIYKASIDETWASATPITSFQGGTVLTGTTTAVTANPPARSEGDPVTYTATVHPVSGTAIPTGTVAFTLGSTQLCNNPIALDAKGQAKCKSSKAPLGAGTVTAVYSGDPTFDASTGTTTETVSLPAGPINTITSVTADPPTSSQGNPVTYTATVHPGLWQPIALLGSDFLRETPTGTVTFAVGTIRLCTAAVALNGVGNAKCTSPRAPVGTDTATATYQPADASFNTSTGTTTETVSAPTTALSPVSSPSAR